ncbi:hypothetical protein TPHA_0D00490 [Tetrapisispora phaffii CBS 4417]|uniref:Uncharacterized protein n=1 Tax=Tetrapisispora phaffii (strain ATCC 24235 / CBS 4417 / NBRC 1672 / NRRL Y-8282 / UCD 70-5) TaxID=1071381 RepID=G8BS72_TETPH|nr:hypothetical protein TPHA_0D00490 [Tetrapisispora phaffii CBS 4417]CCE62693.1 hypothetical protein TPHA_0D00490 [Tetrapisispora phaffii CBS 4417]
MSIDQLTCLIGMNNYNNFTDFIFLLFLFLLTSIYFIQIVGETPSIQFIAWRLSLGNVFIKLVSQYVSIDGLISWKSTRLGANFFTPNIFAKTIEEVKEKTSMQNDSENKKYKSDIIVISGTSLDSFEKNCVELQPFCHPNTIVIVCSDFGVDLESTAKTIFKNNCKFVLSIYCAAECRQLSLGSFALINDQDCYFYIGNTTIKNDIIETDCEPTAVLNLCENFYDDPIMLRFCKIITESKWVIVDFIKDSRKMSAIVWKHIIPKICLNILCIIYDKFEYNELLQNNSTKAIFEDLVDELMLISYKQCQIRIEEFFDPNKNVINYNNIITYSNKKRQEICDTTSNEYPEYLSLPFELYCFYHKLEFPAHILLYQPIILGKKYNVSFSNLNFLYSFYSQLLNLSGFSIFGGLSEQKTYFFHNLKGRLELENDRGSLNVTNYSKSEKKKKHKKHKKKGNKSSTSIGNNVINASQDPMVESVNDLIQSDMALGSSKLPMNSDLTGNDFTNDALFSPGFEDVFLNLRSSLNSTGLIRVDPDLSKTEIKKTSQFNEEVVSYMDSETETSSSESDSQGTNNLHSKKNSKINVKDADNSYSSDESSDIVVLENLSINQNKYKKYSESLVDFFETPKLFKKFKTRVHSNYNGNYCNNQKTSKSETTLMDNRPYSTSCLEFKSKNYSNVISNDLLELHSQMLKLEIQNSSIDNKEKRKQYANLELKLWKLQRRFHEFNGTISKYQTEPLEELLNHIDILNKGNTGDILNWTTCRYGEVDFYKNIRQDKEEIMNLFKDGVNGNKNLKTSILPN